MLTLTEANQAIAAALVSAQNMKMKIAVSVCDDEGRLVAFQRMDGVIVEGIPAAMGKAIAAVATRKPSGERVSYSDLSSVWRVASSVPIMDRPEVFRSLATHRQWVPSVSRERQQIKKTSNSPKPESKLWLDAVIY
jgi:Haem-degrading